MNSTELFARVVDTIDETTDPAGEIMDSYLRSFDIEDGRAWKMSFDRQQKPNVGALMFQEAKAEGERLQLNCRRDRS